MDINDLEEIFKTAKKDTLDVAIELTVPSRKDTEIIIIKRIIQKILYLIDVKI